MKQLNMIRGLFVVSGLYDGILGAAFLLAGPALFSRMGIAGPNHWGYIHFPAMLLLVFAAAFFAVARNPVANRNLIVYGMLLKVSYCGTVICHWMSGGVPDVWKYFVFADLVFLGLFVWAYGVLGGAGSSKSAAAA